MIIRGDSQEGAGIWIYFIDSDDELIVARSRIHQNKSLYYLAPLQMDFSVKIVIGYGLFNFLWKAPTQMFDWFHKTLPINNF